MVFKALNRGKGLLPEPNILQILNSLGNPTSLQLLLNPLLHGAVGGKQGKAERGAQPPPGNSSSSLRRAVPPTSFSPLGILGAAPSVPLVTNPALSTALLQLALQNQTQAQQVGGNRAFAAVSFRPTPPPWGCRSLRAPANKPPLSSGSCPRCRGRAAG